MNFNAQSNRGFSFVKLLVLIGLLAIFISLMIDRTQDGSIRSRVGQGLHIADSAKQALVKTCQARGDAVIDSNSDAGFSFFESMYVSEVRLSGDCASGELQIRIHTQNTGAETSPVLVLLSDSGHSDWNCTLRKGEPSHVPENCRTQSRS